MPNPGYYSGYPGASQQAYNPAINPLIGFNRRTGVVNSAGVNLLKPSAAMVGSFQTIQGPSNNFLAGCTENDVLLNLMIIAMSMFALRDQIFGEDFAAAARGHDRRRREVKGQVQDDLNGLGDQLDELKSQEHVFGVASDSEGRKIFGLEGDGSDRTENSRGHMLFDPYFGDDLEVTV